MFLRLLSTCTTASSTFSELQVSDRNVGNCVSLNNQTS